MKTNPKSEIRSPKSETVARSAKPLRIPHSALRTLLLAFCLLPSALCLAASPLGTAFTYQGRLSIGTNAANGSFDLKFTLFDSLASGNPVGSAVTNSAVAVSNGFFNVTLDFGPNVFNGDARWLFVEVRSNGAAGFTSLSPRQRLLPVPYALYASNTATAGTLSGVLPNTSLVGTYSQPITLNNAANSFSGNGANLTSLNASALTTGVLPDARLSTNVALRSGANTFSGNQVIASGRVGIGTPSPAELLDVRGSTAFIRIDGSNGLSGLSISESNLPRWILFFRQWQGDNLIVRDEVGSRDTMTFESGTGRVGIGTGTPTASLAINSGDAFFTGLDLHNTTTAAGSNGYRLQVVGSSVSGREGNLEIWKKGDNLNLLTAQPGGKLGIRTTAPAATLDVHGDVKADGLRLATDAVQGAVLTATDTLGNAGWDSGLRLFPSSVRIGPGIYLPGTPNLVGGALGNHATNAVGATISGGGWTPWASSNDINVASGDCPTVGGGIGNGALNDYATVPGGFGNTAAGRCSLAAGRRAKALHEGSFVWADNQNADFTSTSSNQFLVRAERVGIGTVSPHAKLDVAGGVVAEDVNAWDCAPGAFAFSGSYSEGSFSNWRNTGKSADCKRVIGSGNRHVGFGVAEGVDIESPVVWMYSQPGNAFEVRAVNYNAQVPSGSTLMSVSSDGVTHVKVLEIQGGADVAEPFPMSSDDIPKGAVVVIDDQTPGRLKLSDRAHDKRVAGVVSGANGIQPGLTLSQEGLLDGGQNVALSGRVYARADARYGPIEPGDLLTTSDTPGHAMKVTDHARAQGAILGKAMSCLQAGKGMVLVLVSLQ